MAASTTVARDGFTAEHEALWVEICPGTGSSHDVRVRGYLPGGRRAGLDCDQPLRVVCRQCPAVTAWACGCHRASKCVPCSERYRRRLVRIAESGSARANGYLYFLTLTAPGLDDHLRWDPGHLRGSRPACACHEAVVSDGLGRWNAGASACWNRLRTGLRRVYADLEFLKATEVQRRGALHYHAICWSSEPLDVLAVQDLALAAGFGCVLDLASIEPGSKRQAYYVAKYVTKACDSREAVPWVVEVEDEETGELRAVRRDASYRAWSASRGWGLTMKVIKARCAVAARAAAEHRRQIALTVGPGIPCAPTGPGAGPSPPG